MSFAQPPAIAGATYLLLESFRIITRFFWHSVAIAVVQEEIRALVFHYEACGYSGIAKVKEFFGSNLEQERTRRSLPAISPEPAWDRCLSGTGLHLDPHRRPAEG